MDITRVSKAARSALDSTARIPIRLSRNLIKISLEYVVHNTSARLRRSKLHMSAIKSVESAISRRYSTRIMQAYDNGDAEQATLFAKQY